jgi:CHAT domain-containing protein
LRRASPLAAVQRYAVSYTQSLSVYRALRKRAAPVGMRQRLPAMGAPTYAAQPAGTASTPVSIEVARSAALEALPDQWPPLPGALEEVRRVARLFADAVVLTGSDASEDKLREMEAAGELRKFRYLHFAAHAFLSTSVPELSAVVLRQPGNAQWDGYLTAAEWSTLRLESDLIVLSACETALGKHVAG